MRFCALSRPVGTKPMTHRCVSDGGDRGTNLATGKVRPTPPAAGANSFLKENDMSTLPLRLLSGTFPFVVGLALMAAPAFADPPGAFLKEAIQGNIAEV